MRGVREFWRHCAGHGVKGSPVRMAFNMVPKIATAFLLIFFLFSSCGAGISSVYALDGDGKIANVSANAADDLFSPIRRASDVAADTAEETSKTDDEAGLTEAELTIHLLRRVEKALVYVFVMLSFISGQLLWRLTVLSKSQRNIL